MVLLSTAFCRMLLTLSNHHAIQASAVILTTAVYFNLYLTKCNKRFRILNGDTLCLINPLTNNYG